MSVSTEHQQIKSQIEKHDFSIKDNVIPEQPQKIYCHFCPNRTEIISKEFFYKFTDGKAVFFCNPEQRLLWMKLHKLA